MSILEDVTKSTLFIPKIVSAAKIYLESTRSERIAILNEYQDVIEVQNYLLFYFKLFEQPNQVIDFDDFNWIPLTYSEVTMLSTYANVLDTLMQGDVNLFVNTQQVRYAP
jgi:hypothetical protein